jgi:hypothetical protein
METVMYLIYREFGKARLADLHAQAERDALGCIRPVRLVLRAGERPGSRGSHDDDHDR